MLFSLVIILFIVHPGVPMYPGVPGVPMYPGVPGVPMYPGVPGVPIYPGVPGVPMSTSYVCLLYVTI